MELSLFTSLLKAYWKTAVAITLAAALAWWIEGLRWDADVSKRNEAHTAELKKQSDQAVIDLTNQKKRVEAAQIALAALDAKHTKEMAHEQAKNEKLRADVESGAKRLQFNATCKRLPQPSGTASLDDATSPRLNDSAQRDYFSLRDRIGKATNQITGLQEYVREQCSN